MLIFYTDVHNHAVKFTSPVTMFALFSRNIYLVCNIYLGGAEQLMAMTLYQYTTSHYISAVLTTPLCDEYRIITVSSHLPCGHSFSNSCANKLAWCSSLLSYSLNRKQYTTHVLFKQNVTLLFLRLHCQMLTNFNDICYYFSWRNLQPNDIFHSYNLIIASLCKNCLLYTSDAADE